MHSSRETHRLSSRSLAVVIVAYLLYAMLGFPDGMVGVAWPQIMEAFGVSHARMGAMLFASTIGVLLTSFNTARLIRRCGMSSLLAISGVVRGLGLVGFAGATDWWAVLVAAFFLGAGSGTIDGGLNTFFAMRIRSPRLMNWLHACYGVGATIAPIGLTALFGLGIGWRWGYVIIAVLQTTMGLVVCLRAGDWQLPGEADAAQIHTEHNGVWASLARPRVWINVALFFFYAGVEVTAGNWSYSVFTETRGVTSEVAGLVTGLYWGCFTAGRLLFGAIANRFTDVSAMRVLTLMALVGATLFWWSPVNDVGFAGLVVLGFALAPVFPLLMAATPLRLGAADAENAIGIQVAAASLGIGVLPGLVGGLADITSMEIVGPCIVAGLVVAAILNECASLCGRSAESPTAQP